MKMMSKAWIGLAITMALAGPAQAGNLVKVKYKTPTTPAEVKAKKLIEKSGITSEFEQLVDAYFPLEKPMHLVYGGDDGPLYDPQLHVMYIPYHFVSESIGYFSQDLNADLASIGAMDTLMHTLLHEAGHALVFDNRIPILGKEEDAVDNLATLLMIKYVEDGADAAINAANMFDYESQEGNEFYDYSEYIDEHSFELQRYFSTLCMVYGSDPVEFEHLLDEVEADSLEEKQETCISHYQDIDDNWHHYLVDD
jgi:hypothetical protein